MKLARAHCALLVVAVGTAAAARSTTVSLRDRRVLAGSAVEGVQELDAQVTEAEGSLRCAVELLAEASAATKNTTGKHIGDTSNASAHTANKTTKLQAQLSTLNSVYESLKKSIVRGNRREHDGQLTDEEQIRRTEAKLADAERELNSSKLSDFKREMLVNQTRVDRAELKFWKSHRGSSHAIFHAHLKMAHGMMDRIKQVVGEYEAVLAGKKVDLEKLRKLQSSLPPRPHIERTAAADAPTAGKALANQSATNKTKLVLVHRAQPPPVVPAATPAGSKGSQPAPTAPVKR